MEGASKELWDQGMAFGVTCQGSPKPGLLSYGGGRSGFSLLFSDGTKLPSSQGSRAKQHCPQCWNLVVLGGGDGLCLASRRLQSLLSYIFTVDFN